MFSSIQTAAPPLKQRSFGFGFFTGLIAALSLMMVLSASAQAATPVAGATISNQATADYKDSGGTDQKATSNLVVTTVTQVGSFTLVNDNSKIAAAGTTVYMPHTLTNTGNGSDTFYLTLPGTFDTNNLNSVSIFADTNSDGSPDGPALCTVGGSPACTGTNVSTGALASGASFNFVVAMAVKATAADGAVVGTETVTAVPNSSTSWFSTYSPASISNDDDLTVANNVAVFAVNKAFNTGSLTTGPAGTTAEYRLNYTNSGNAAGPLYIKDLIGTGSTANFSYVTGATWSGSGSGAVALTDAAAGDPTGILYQAVTSGSSLGATTTIEALIASVPANASGYITFKVLVDTDAPLGTSGTTNTADYAIGDTCSGALPCTPATVTTTNQAPFTVTGDYSVVANNSSGSTADGDNTTAAGNDLVTAAAVAPGIVVSFDNYIHNTGSVTDTFNITYNAANFGGATAFPAGTTFQLLQADGSSPLTSSDGDGIPDTGPLASGGTYKVVLTATIPANACSLINCATASNFTVAKTATSKGNPAESNTVFDQLAAITPPSVDLTNENEDVSGTDGDGPGSLTAVITTESVAPGGAAQFDLVVTNFGLAIDNYNLAYHLTTGSTLASAAAFVPGTLPSGWSVAIHSGTCSAIGGVVSNTGAIAAGASATFCAVVTTPSSGATAAAGTYNAYFRVTSGATGASDIKLDAVTLTAQNVLSLAPDGTGQIQPGGTILYPHTLLNGGNNSCGPNFTFNVTNSGAGTGWTYVLYYDVNGDGAVDSGDVVIGGGSNASDTLVSAIPALAAGLDARLLVKVQAPSGASSGANAVINVTAVDTTGTCGSTNQIGDTTTVLAGQIRLEKFQALGVWNTGTSTCDAPAAAYSKSARNQRPGQCVWYKVVATNDGDAAVTDVVINDATPTFTTYGGGGACTSTGTVTGTPALGGAGAASVGSTGPVTCGTWTSVPPDATTELVFSVRIDP